jgi:hypothetical protein
MTCQTRLLGFPPADHDVRDFLTSIDSDNPEMDKISFSRARHFLKALFVITKRTIIEELGDGDGACERENRIHQFRTYMSDEQSMDTSGSKRKSFYHDVINMAKTVRRTTLMSFNPFKPWGCFEGYGGR